MDSFSSLLILIGVIDLMQTHPIQWRHKGWIFLLHLDLSPCLEDLFTSETLFNSTVDSAFCLQREMEEMHVCGKYWFVKIEMFFWWHFRFFTLEKFQMLLYCEPKHWPKIICPLLISNICSTSDLNSVESTWAKKDPNPRVPCMTVLNLLSNLIFHLCHLCWNVCFY